MAHSIALHKISKDSPCLPDSWVMTTKGPVISNSYYILNSLTFILHWGKVWYIIIIFFLLFHFQEETYFKNKIYSMQLEINFPHVTFARVFYNKYEQNRHQLHKRILRPWFTSHLSIDLLYSIKKCFSSS